MVLIYHQEFEISSISLQEISFKIVIKAGIELEKVTMLLHALILASAAMVSAAPVGEGFLPPNETFTFNVECRDLEQNSCEAAQESMKAVGEMIAKEIFFTVPLVVNVEFLKFSSRGIRGGIVQSDYIRPLYQTTEFASKQNIILNFESISSNITYPMSIIKSNSTQYLATSGGELMKPDLKLSINTDENWAYTVNDPIGESEIDFKCNCN